MLRLVVSLFHSYVCVREIVFGILNDLNLRVPKTKCSRIATICISAIAIGTEWVGQKVRERG